MNDNQLIWENYQQLNEELSPRDIASSLIGMWGKGDEVKFKEFIEIIKDHTDDAAWFTAMDIIRDIPPAEMEGDKDRMWSILLIYSDTEPV